MEYLDQLAAKLKQVTNELQQIVCDACDYILLRKDITFGYNRSKKKWLIMIVAV